MKALRALALLAVIWLAGESAYTVHYARQRSVYTFDQLNKVLRETTQTMDEVRKAAGVWERSSQEQSSKTTQAMSNVSAAAARFTTFIAHMDAQSSEFLSTTTSAITQQNASLLESQSQLRTELSEMGKATILAQQTLASANEQITNPALKESVDKFAESSANLATATREGADTMAKVHQGVEYEVNQLMKPITKVKAALLFTAEIVGKFLGI